jgi:hypothetical protein
MRTQPPLGHNRRSHQFKYARENLVAAKFTLGFLLGQRADVMDRDDMNRCVRPRQKSWPLARSGSR